MSMTMDGSIVGQHSCHAMHDPRNRAEKVATQRISYAIFSRMALDMLCETLERRPPPHRAGPDSARLADAWRKAIRNFTALHSRQIHETPCSGELKKPGYVKLTAQPHHRPHDTEAPGPGELRLVKA